MEMKEVLAEIQKTFEALKERNDKAVAEAEKRNGEMRAEDKAALDAIREDMATLKEAYNELAKRSNRPKFGNDKEVDEEVELRKAAFIKMVRHGVGENSKAIWTPEEYRALSSASDADGGWLVPEDFQNEIIMKAFDEAEFRPYANVGTTGRDRVRFPAMEKPSVAWGNINIATSETDLDAGTRVLPIHNLRALFRIHNDTLADTDADIIGELTMGGAMAIAEAEDDAFVSGNKENEPTGVLTNTTVQANYQASGVADALFDASNNGVDALTKCMYKVLKTYRRQGVFMMNSTTEGVVMTLKDGSGQYYWQPPVAAGAPSTFRGKPVANPEGMPDIAAGAFPILFGDPRKGYKIRDRQGITVQRLTERYAEYDHTAFIIKRRVGGMVTLPEAFAVVKIAAS